MRRRAGFFLIVFSFALLPLSAFAYASNICKGTTCTAEEVGQFMVGITEQCGNKGDCTLKDIEQVFLSVGSFVLGIIGAVVLLMYVIGGFYMLASRGDPSKITKGKEYIKISTIGLLIVMFAYIAIATLQAALKTGNLIACEAPNSCTNITPEEAAAQKMSCSLGPCPGAQLCCAPKSNP